MSITMRFVIFGFIIGFAFGVVIERAYPFHEDGGVLLIEPLTLDRELTPADISDPNVVDFSYEDPRMTLPRVSPTPAQPGLNYVYPGREGQPDLYVAPDGRMDYLYKYGADR